MCKYCENNRITTLDSSVDGYEGIEVCIDTRYNDIIINAFINVEVEDGMFLSTPIKFCPMCGRKL